MGIKSIFFNGNIITFDNNRKAAAVLVEDGVIKALGADKEILARKDASAVLVDLKGRTVIPGFNDNHIHLLFMGQQVDLPQLYNLSAHEIIGVLKEKYPRPAPGVIIEGMGWDYPACPAPHKSFLDKYFPHNSVILMQFGGHGMWVNSYALKKIGIGPKTADSPKGEIVRDSNGEATGILKEAHNLPYLNRHYRNMIFNKRLTTRYLNETFPLLAESGITSVQDNTWFHGLVQVLTERRQKKGLSCRISCWSHGEHRILKFLMDRQKYLKDEVSRGPVKFFLDGTFSSKNAWLTEPYQTEGNGKMVCGTGKSAEEIYRLMAPHIKRHRQTACHAIGDKTIMEYLTAVTRLQKKYPWTRDLRLRLEHAQLIRPEDFSRIRDLDICISAQPAALTTPEKDAALLGKERALKAYPYRTLLEQGIPLSFGSDFPGEPIYKPLEIIRHVINRESPERISLYDAIKAYTGGSAYAEFQEHQKGILKEGFLADFIVLNKNPFEIKQEDFGTVEVMTTVTGGRVVFDKSP